MNRADRETALRLRRLREEYEAERDRILDEHMAERYPNASDFWRAAARASVEVASWPKWKRDRTYAQPGPDIEDPEREI